MENLKALIVPKAGNKIRKHWGQTPVKNDKLCKQKIKIL